MNLDEFQDGCFSVWQPNSVDLIKSQANSDPDAPWYIGGWASTAHEDRQEENVFQKGLDFEEWKEHGWFNDNHQQHTSAAIGLPGNAKLLKAGWWVDGELLKDVPRACEVYQLAKALRKANTNRRLGFSIEGKIIERLGNCIRKALIRNVAITNCPVNTNCTWDIIAKSWASDTMLKAADVGYQMPPTSGAGVLVPESLEHGELRVVYECPTCSKAFASEGTLNNHLHKAHKLGKSTVVLAHPDLPIQRRMTLLTETEALERAERQHPEWDWKSPTVREAFLAHVARRSAEQPIDEAA